jgi:FlaG/FlaF family flagellin (archaellin)
MMKKQNRMTGVSDVPVVTLLTRVGVTSILAAVVAVRFVADNLSTVLAASPAATDTH